MIQAAAKPVRVAVYTRKSTEEGLDQDFNTLDAQREAVEALVRSRREMGWEVIPEQYDDGGFSGANMERPAFVRLMEDVEEGRVDVVACYRLDRLSRSLIDFLRTVDYLERRGVAFVSVTESFDTASPTGRLAMRILAVFAQFERESIAQRTRDKMRAARRRGKWTGGHPPLGYDVVEGHLIVNDAEAEQVRLAFTTYMENGGLVSTASELGRRGIRTKTWETQKGTVHEGRAFTKSTVRALLTNAVYVGRVRCKGEDFPGEHDAIIDEGTWDAVQAQLQRNGGDQRRRSPNVSILQGMVRCDVCGAAMHPTTAQKGVRQYHYYACATAQKQGAGACPRSRIAVGELEAFVVDRVREIGRDPELLAATIEAAHEGLVSRREEIAAEITRLQTERDRLARHGKTHADVAAKGGPGAAAVRTRLTEIEAETTAINERLEELEREREGLSGMEIDDAELAELLQRFDPLWEALLPPEKARVLALLIERVRVDAPASEIEIRFRADGIKTLTEEGSA